MTEIVHGLKVVFISMLLYILAESHPAVKSWRIIPSQATETTSGSISKFHSQSLMPFKISSLSRCVSANMLLFALPVSTVSITPRKGACVAPRRGPGRKMYPDRDESGISQNKTKSTDNGL